MNLKKSIQLYLDFISDKYLSIRPRAENELKFYLLRKVKKKYPDDINLSENLIEGLIHGYKKRNILNDDDFVAWWINERTYFKPRGRRALESELLRKGVSIDVLKKYFEICHLDESEMIQRILQKRTTQNDLTHQPTRKKITTHLLRKGFSYDNIKKAIEDFIEKK